MATLTVTEKEHWKKRISKRIDKRIETITVEDPNFFDRIKREARQRSLGSLGLAEYQAELDQLERRKAALKRREKQLGKAMLAQVRGVSPEDLDEYLSYRHDAEIENAIQQRQAVHEEELLVEQETGRQVLALRQERDNLLDTVWLATSPRHIRTLWEKAGELLGDQQTQLQRDALAIPPVTDQ